MIMIVMNALGVRYAEIIPSCTWIGIPLSIASTKKCKGLLLVNIRMV